MALHLYDGIAVVRRDLESDSMGRVPRKILNDMFALPKGDVAIWCWDGKGAKAYRQRTYPAYKAKRLPQPDGVWKTITMIQDMLRHTPALQVTIPEYEADDLIAYYVGFGVPTKIHSVDRDLSALLVSNNITATFSPINGVSAGWVQFYKSTVGDQSDNLKGIPGFGEKTWEKLRGMGMLDMLEDKLNGKPVILNILAELPKKSQDYLAEHLDEWRAQRDVIRFREVPNTDDYVVTGVPNYQLGDSILARFMQ